MAQDFGDDIGDMLLRSVERFVMDAAREHLREQMKNVVRDFHEQKLIASGMSKDEARAAAEVMASKAHVCMPFGTDADAAYFTQVCRDNEVWAFAMTDGHGKGHVLIAEDDIPKMRNCINQFSEVMTLVKNQEISEMIDKAKAVPDDVLKRLKPIKDMPELPKTHVSRMNEPEKNDNTRKNQLATDSAHPKDASHVTRDLADDPYNHTSLIRDKVLAAREQCRDLEDFKAILAEKGIGTRLNDDGELQFYEGRRGENGEVLEFDKSMDWPVNAKTLASDKYQCDATLDWFEKNTPKEPTVPPQVDLNLICNAVRRDLEERGIGTRDRPDGEMGFLVNVDHKQDVVKAVEARFPGHVPEELGIGFVHPGRYKNEPERLDAVSHSEPQVTDGSRDTDGRTPDADQGIESHDGMDTATNTARMEREQSNTDVAPSVVRESSQPRLKEVEKECRAASRQLAQSNDSPDRDISDKFQQER